MRQTDTEAHLARLQAELFEETGGAVPEAEIRRVLQQALRDLAGSVSGDSLPEMASRLAVTRLSSSQHNVLAAA